MNYVLEYGHSVITVETSFEDKDDLLSHLIRDYDTILDYVNANPLFGTSYEPVDVDEDAPPIIRRMSEAARLAGVGPMASVAGTISQSLGEHISRKGCPHVVVENGGDIYARVDRSTVVGLFCGKSMFSQKIGFLIEPGETPIAICTSSSTVGHSVNLGKADSVTVFSKDCHVADAFATAYSNMICSQNDAAQVAEKAMREAVVDGIFVVYGDILTAKGKIPEITGLDSL